MYPFSLIYAPFPEVMKGEVYGIVHWIKEKQRFMIVIDSGLSEDEQRKTLKHELSHIILKHYEKDHGIRDDEEEADRYADQMSDEELSYLMTFALSEKRLSGHFDGQYNFIPA